MAKSIKFTSKVPKLEDYKPSWLKIGEDGEREVDIDAALKAAYTLTVDKAKAQDAREDAVAEVAERTTERDELQSKVDDKNAPDAQVEIGKANARAEKAEAAAKAAESRAARAEVVAEKGLTAKQAKYLPKDGSKEDLETAADEILEDFPEAAKVEETEEEREEREEREAEEAAVGGRTRPRTTALINPADPASGSEKEYDYDKVADQIMGGGIRY